MDSCGTRGPAPCAYHHEKKATSSCDHESKPLHMVGAHAPRRRKLQHRCKCHTWGHGWWLGSHGKGGWRNVVFGERSMLLACCTLLVLCSRSTSQWKTNVSSSRKPSSVRNFPRPWFSHCVIWFAWPLMATCIHGQFLGGYHRFVEMFVAFQHLLCESGPSQKIKPSHR